MSLSLATRGVICPGSPGLSIATKGVICISGVVAPSPVIPDIYKQMLCEELGPDGIFTEPAIYDPTGTAIELNGIFDENNFRNNRGPGRVEQKKDGPRFIVCEIDFDIDIYEDMKIYLSHRDKTFTIHEIDYDEQGAQVLWLL